VVAGAVFALSLVWKLCEGQYDGNLEKVKLSAQKEMGVFIISAFNNGGRLYAQSKKLGSLTLPDLEPISYGALNRQSNPDHLPNPEHVV
jgi:predicted aldo/keto reductase-like oxidoreductase